MKEWLLKMVIRIMEYYSKSKNLGRKIVSPIYKSTPSMFMGCFHTHITPFGRKKKPNPPTKWSAAEWVNSETHEFVNTGFFLIFCTGDFLEMFVLVSHSGIPIIQTKISFTGEQ